MQRMPLPFPPLPLQDGSISTLGSPTMLCLRFLCQKKVIFCRCICTEIRVKSFKICFETLIRFLGASKQTFIS